MRLRKAHRFFALSSADQWLFIKALIGLPLVVASLRMLGYKRTQRLLATGIHPTPASTDSITDEEHNRLRQCRQALRLSGKYGITEGNCLSRSLLLRRLLHSRGVDTDLRIGVQKKGDNFKAHAWLEYKAQPINDRADIHARYNAFTHQVDTQLRALDKAAV